MKSRVLKSELRDEGTKSRIHEFMKGYVNREGERFTYVKKKKIKKPKEKINTCVFDDLV